MRRRSLFGCTDEVKTSCRAVDAAMKGAKFMLRIIRICHGWGIGFWLLVQVYIYTYIYATLSSFLFFNSSSAFPFFNFELFGAIYVITLRADELSYKITFMNLIVASVIGQVIFSNYKKTKTHKTIPICAFCRMHSSNIYALSKRGASSPIYDWKNVIWRQLSWWYTSICNKLIVLALHNCLLPKIFIPTAYEWVLPTFNVIYSMY